MRITAFVLALVFSACHQPDPQAVVDRAIVAMGGDRIDGTVISFDFRGKHFTVTHDGGRFQYDRDYVDSSGTVHEVLNNDELYREVDGARVSVEGKARDTMEEDINSVVYFALLPYRLNDRAVYKRYLGPATIGGESYDMVEITFRPDGGGRDYHDRFVYWFHRQRATMDFLAYYYHTSERGSRFRQAVNPREVGGIHFADYYNFKTDSLGIDEIERYGEQFEAGKLSKISDINLENIAVQKLPN